MNRNTSGKMPPSSNLNRANTLHSPKKTTTNSSTTNTKNSTKLNQLNPRNPISQRTVIAKNTAASPTLPPAITATTATNADNTNYTSQITNNNINNTDNPINFASITAKETSPNREQAIVFNSIDGVPQKDYILAIGQIVQPRNILFVSRISNNRFCIFLSSKEILESLLSKTQIININGQEIQIRRLLNPAKRIVISNVCPSIPNHVILHSLNNLGISPTSQINFLKAGINLDGYEHILSFRRQMYIKHEDTIKLPGSLILNHNQCQFRIFFTDDTITCYTCKTTGHTAQTCKRNVSIIAETPSPPTTSSKNTVIDTPTSDLTPPIIDSDQVVSQTSQHDFQHPNPNTNKDHIPPTPPAQINMETKESDTHEQHVISISQALSNTEQIPLTTQTNIQNKRAISDTSSLMSPPSTPLLKVAQQSVQKQKKQKIRSQSNSSSITDDDTPDDPLNPAQKLFYDDKPLPITYTQFKYLVECSSNKSVNIRSLCEEANIELRILMALIEKTYAMIKNSRMKTKLTKFRNLLFQLIPEEPSDPTQNQ